MGEATFCSTVCVSRVRAVTGRLPESGQQRGASKTLVRHTRQPYDGRHFLTPTFTRIATPVDVTGEVIVEISNGVGWVGILEVLTVLSA